MPAAFVPVDLLRSGLYLHRSCVLAITCKSNLHHTDYKNQYFASFGCGRCGLRALSPPPSAPQKSMFHCVVVSAKPNSYRLQPKGSL